MLQTSKGSRVPYTIRNNIEMPDQRCLPDSVKTLKKLNQTKTEPLPRSLCQRICLQKDSTTRSHVEMKLHFSGKRRVSRIEDNKDLEKENILLSNGAKSCRGPTYQGMYALSCPLR
ncbi:hypothetical protein TNCV_4996331 [Trichonephila clavipes]|nr:hypothetical protein TNCV_4996331 [Trichonephila clavipes]